MTRTTPSEIFAPTKEMLTRRQIPDCLYVVVDNVAFSTVNHEDGSVVASQTEDFHAKLDFACESLTGDDLRAHLIHSNCSNIESSFISAFEDEGTRGLLLVSKNRLIITQIVQ